LQEIIRGRVLARIAASYDLDISDRVFSSIAGTPLQIRMNGDVLKPAHEADQIRAFIASPGPAALVDLPWSPVYLAICFFLHPLIGWLVAGQWLR
jgi:ATP-binding cassette, subfamily C, bacterial PrsD